MEYAVPFGQQLSVIEVVQAYPTYFYYPLAEMRHWRWYEILTTKMPIRADVIDNYMESLETHEVHFARSFPTLPDLSGLPNIAELTSVWVAYMEVNGVYHGQRSMLTPSSTPFENHVLCMYLMVNEYLAIRPNVRKSSELIRPD